MDPILKIRLKNQFTSATISGVLTAVFMYILYYHGWQSVAAGICIGFFANLGISYYANFVAKPYLRKSNLFLVLMINSLVQVIIMFLVALVFVGIFFASGDFVNMIDNFSSSFRNNFMIGIAFGLVLSFFFNFYSIVTTLIGQNILGRLFLGMYRNPIETDRVFMFLDLASSTSIAEKTGHLKFLSLVNDFFYDITEPIRQTKGEIYKYVGDEVIITWKTKDAVDKANCIRCFFLIDEFIAKKAPYYIERYGIVPGFKAGLHGGLAVTGELGYAKREIAFMGDVVNTTARIEESCKTYGKRFVVSEFLVNRIAFPDGISAVEVGNVKLRGKENELRLFSVEKD